MEARMYKHNERVNIVSVIAETIMTILFGGIAFVAPVSGSLLGALFLGSLTALCGWALWEDLKKGVRKPNTWERFSAWMFIRPILVGVAGFLAFNAVMQLVPPLTDENRGMGVLILLLGLGLWIAALVYTLWHVQGRDESDAT
jgi:uncharacterized membrane protein HdeD (DUF308 family)